LEIEHQHVREVVEKCHGHCGHGNKVFKSPRRGIEARQLHETHPGFGNKLTEALQAQGPALRLEETDKLVLPLNGGILRKF